MISPPFDTCFTYLVTRRVSLYPDPRGSHSISFVCLLFAVAYFFDMGYACNFSAFVYVVYNTSLCTSVHSTDPEKEAEVPLIIPSLDILRHEDMLHFNTERANLETKTVYVSKV